MKKEKPVLLKVFLWAAAILSMIGIMVSGIEFFHDENLDLLIEFTLITIVGFIYLFMISGKKTFTFFGNSLGYTIRILLPTLIFSFIFFCFGVISFFSERPPLNPDWLKNLLLSALNMFLVGIYEETYFRSCATDSLLPLFRKLKHPFFLTAVVAGLVFGYVHVVSVDFSDLQQVLQFVLKIATTGLTGITYMLVYFKTRNLLGIGIIHGLNDFIPDLLYQIFLWKSVDNSTSYTTGDSGTTIVYAVQLVFELLIFIQIYKKVAKTIDYQKTLEEW